MKKSTKRFLASLLVLAMTLTLVFQNYKPTEVMAEDSAIITWDAKTLVETYTANTANNGLRLVSTDQAWEVSSDESAAQKFGLSDASYAKATANGKDSATHEHVVYLEYTATEAGEMVIMEKTNKKKVFKVVSEDGSEVAVADNSAGSASSYDVLKFNVVAGQKYYGYISGSKAAIFQVQFIPESAAEQPVEWKDVKTPVVDKVVVNEDGEFEIDFTGKISDASGCDSIEIVALCDGIEAGNAISDNDAVKTVKIKPYWNGKYTFYAIGRRAGEGIKKSEVYSYGDFILSVNKPVITFAKNLGGGKVYLDWLNVDGIDNYSIYQKQNGTDNYTLVEENYKQGDITLTLSNGTYDFRVEALREDGEKGFYELKGFEVSDDTSDKWGIAIVGAAQKTDVTVDGTAYALDITDSVQDKKNVYSNVKAANEASEINFAATSYGKISDSEMGGCIYYTKINPEKENFVMEATFEVTDISLTPDNQTGFGIMAADMLGVNYWGKPDYKHKYYNMASSLCYGKVTGVTKMNKTVSGYTSCDTMSNEGVTRQNGGDKLSVDGDFNVGSVYTIKLEKNDTSYISTINGVSKTWDNNSITSVQEDGSVVVGIFVARKIGVKVSNVKFTKTATENGVNSEEVVDDKITPSIRVYSSNDIGAEEYEFIAVPNCSGSITVASEFGFTKTIENVELDDVVRVMVPVELGKNTITATFKPTGDNIKSKDAVETKTTVTRKEFDVENNVIYCSADAKETGKGTKEDPVALKEAVKYVKPGQTIYLFKGTYTDPITVGRSISGNEENPINIVAEDYDGSVVFTSQITIVGNYIHLYGIYSKDSAGVGIQISGNNNLIDRCVVEHASNTGIQISRSGSASNKAGRVGKLWPTDNVVINCTSFDNCDAGRNDADGFAAKLTTGEGNKFVGCIAHNNIDDGWDFYAKGVSGQIGTVEIIECVAYNNGWLTTDDITNPDFIFGEGNGFKLGGEDIPGGHTIRDSVAFNNHGKGITSNSCPDIVIINCTSYGNQVKNNSFNVGLNTKASNLKGFVVTNLISMNPSQNTTVADLIPSSQINEGNYIYNGEKSVNSEGKEASNDWFESVDLSIVPTRNSDGTINMQGLLVKNENAPKNSGAIISGNSVSSAPAFEYEFFEGNDPEINKGDKTELKLQATSEFEKFQKLMLDGKEIDASNYEITRGSTNVVLSSDYVASLEAGEHKLTLVAKDGEAVTTITVKGSAEVVDKADDTVVDDKKDDAVSDEKVENVEEVKTGDNQNIMLYVVIAMMSVMILVVISKKRFKA